MNKPPGKQLEDYILARIREVYPNARLTPGSGNVLDDGDQRTPYWVIECKDTTKKDNINILGKWIDKVRAQAYIRSKEWALVSRSKKGDLVISLDFNVFIELLKGEFPYGRREKGSSERDGDDERRKNESSEESSSECEQETWKGDDIRRLASGRESPHGSSLFRPPDKTIR